MVSRSENQFSIQKTPMQAIAGFFFFFFSFYYIMLTALQRPKQSLRPGRQRRVGTARQAHHQHCARPDMAHLQLKMSLALFDARHSIVIDMRVEHCTGDKATSSVQRNAQGQCPNRQAINLTVYQNNWYFTKVCGKIVNMLLKNRIPRNIGTCSSNEHTDIVGTKRNETLCALSLRIHLVWLICFFLAKPYTSDFCTKSLAINTYPVLNTT